MLHDVCHTSIMNDNLVHFFEYKACCTHGADDMVITNANRILIVKLEVKRQLGEVGGGWGTHARTHTHTLRNTK